MVRWLCDRLIMLAAAGVSIVAAATLLAWLSRWFFLAELASHFRLQYFCLATAAALTLAVGKHFRWAALATLVAMLNLATLLPLYAAPYARQPPANQGPNLRLVSLNVYSSNRRRDEVVEWLRESRADYILLLEVTPAWHDALALLADDYPLQRVVPRADNFGIALLSRQTPDDIEVIYTREIDLPSIVARYTVGGESLTLIGTHPLPPGSPAMWRMRDAQLAAIAAEARSKNGPLVLAGDLNVTSWSAAFDLLTDRTRLVDSRAGFGVQPSWPKWFGPGRIPIDHCLVTPEIAVRDRFVGPDLGSDHFPIVVDFTIQKVRD